MKPTRTGPLVGIFVGLGVVSWALLRLVEKRGGVLPAISWPAPTGLLALGVVVLVTALGLRTRLASDDRKPHPLSMARMAVLGKASAHVGPIVAGFYAGYALVLLPTLDVPDRRDRAELAAIAVLACVLLTAAGLYLERLCRVKPRGPGLHDLDDAPGASST